MDPQIQNWIRTLLPSWRLFERTGEVAKIYFRYSPTEKIDSDWILRTPQLENTNIFKKLFFNPSSTKEHTFQNKIYHFLYETESLYPDRTSQSISVPAEAIENMLSFIEMKKDIIDRIFQLYNKPFYFQFQIRSKNQTTKDEVVLLESSIFQSTE